MNLSTQLSSIHEVWFGLLLGYVTPVADAKKERQPINPSLRQEQMPR